jgi:hypothetical protein
MTILLKNSSDQKSTLKNTTKAVRPLRENCLYAVLESRFYEPFQCSSTDFKKIGGFSAESNDKTRPQWFLIVVSHRVEEKEKSPPVVIVAKDQLLVIATFGNRFYGFYCSFAL